MRRFVVILCALGVAVAQESGRDAGKDRPVLFVRWAKSAESGEIYRAAWRALERFRGLQRRRLVDLGEDEARARVVFAQHKDAAVVVALGAQAAALARRALPKAGIVEVSMRAEATVPLIVDRDHLARIVRRFAPDAKRVAVAAGNALPGFKTVERKHAMRTDLVWIAEGATTGAKPTQVAVSTDWIQTRATLHVRPSAQSSGWLAAASVRRSMQGKPMPSVRPRRLRITIDLAWAHASGHRVSLDMLARADTVRGTS